jgi:hypothetical protein
MKLPSRDLSPSSAPPLEWQAGIIQLEVCRVMIDRLIREGILKVRQFHSCTTTSSRRPIIPRNQQTASNPYPSTPPAVALGPLAASQLS